MLLQNFGNEISKRDIALSLNIIYILRCAVNLVCPCNLTSFNYQWFASCTVNREQSESREWLTKSECKIAFSDNYN